MHPLLHDTLYGRDTVEEEDSKVLYDYEKVQNWSDHIIGGLFDLKHLFVPINIKKMNTTESVAKGNSEKNGEIAPL